MQVNLTCNATLEDMHITGELPIVGSLNFHRLGLIIAGACSAIAILISFYSIFMHALHYTKPREQRHIIRIILMIPVYAVARFLSFYFYTHAVYYAVISDCYEAFAIASFFALLCHYTSPSLHTQKAYFRTLQPIRPWVWPLSWMRKCCGGERGCWRTPRSGLTWFNIIWVGIYQYCFFRVAMTITAVVTQYFGVYCESSNMPWFAHIWVLVIDAVAVTIAMYLLIQFYIQLRHDLAPHRPFLKVLAIKLVIFFSFWQTFIISILTSSAFHILSPTAHLAFPDLYVGIPSLLICIEMAIFAVMHLFAYPHKPYTTAQHALVAYPSPDATIDALGPNQGGPLGILAIVDALNPWDMVKGFGRGIRWIFVGRRRRELDDSYKYNPNDDTAMPLESAPGAIGGVDTAYRPVAVKLPIAEQFTRGRFGQPPQNEYDVDGEDVGLIGHAQANPETGRGSPSGSPYRPARMRYDPVTGQEVSVGGRVYAEGSPISPFGGAQAHVHPALRGEVGEEEKAEGTVEVRRVRVVPSVEMEEERRRMRSLHGEVRRV